MRQSGEHSNCATDSVDRFSSDTDTVLIIEKIPKTDEFTLCSDRARHPGDPEDR